MVSHHHDRVIELSAWTRKEDGQYSSWCPELDIASCGNTAEQAVSNLDEAIQLYLATLAEEGELLTVLGGRGLLPEKGELRHNAILSKLSAKIPVPV